MNLRDRRATLKLYDAVIGLQRQRVRQEKPFNNSTEQIGLVGNALLALSISSHQPGSCADCHADTSLLLYEQPVEQFLVSHPYAPSGNGVRDVCRIPPEESASHRLRQRSRRLDPATPLGFEPSRATVREN
jgi:hypothetical protein